MHRKCANIVFNLFLRFKSELMSRLQLIAGCIFPAVPLTSRHKVDCSNSAIPIIITATACTLKLIPKKALREFNTNIMHCDNRGSNSTPV